MHVAALILILMTAILDHTGRPFQAEEPRQSLIERAHRSAARTIRAYYDAAQTTAENANHWAWADQLSARAAHNPSVRRTLRIRARYEIANCPLARGILNRMADYVIGTGPTLQVNTGNEKFNQQVERRWQEWCVATGYVHKLWLLYHAELESGESFGLYFNNPGLESDVQLDVRVLEADQIANPLWDVQSDGGDGVKFDAYGNPVAYQILRSHPGDTGWDVFQPGEYDLVPAYYVRHLFRAERPGQVRGVPCTTAALPLFALRRRYMLAVVSTAEEQANITGAIESNTNVEDPDDIEPLEAIDTARRQLLTLPRGWKLNHLKSEQPNETFEMFDKCLIRETGRAVDMPYGLAAQDSSDYNFASGKLDLVPFYKRVVREQDRVEDTHAEPTFARWYREARLIPGYFRGGPSRVPEHTFLWDGQDFLDPREASAKAESLKHGIETLPILYARQGKDFEREMRAGAKAMGVTVAKYKKSIYANIFEAEAKAKPPAEMPDDEPAPKKPQPASRNGRRAVA